MQKKSAKVFANCLLSGFYRQILENKNSKVFMSRTLFSLGIFLKVTCTFIFLPLGSRSLFLVCVSAERGVDVGMSAVLAPCVAVTVDTPTSLTSSTLFPFIGEGLGGRMICRSTCITFSSSCFMVCVPKIS